MSIPKIINKVYINDSMEMPSMLDLDLQKVHKSWETLNPDYIIKYWSGKDCEKYLSDHFPEIFSQTFKALTPYAYKCDFPHPRKQQYTQYAGNLSVALGSRVWHR